MVPLLTTLQPPLIVVCGDLFVVFRIITEECYPYTASKGECLDGETTCPNVNSSTAKIVLYVTPPYRVRQDVSTNYSQ